MTTVDVGASMAVDNAGVERAVADVDLAAIAANVGVLKAHAPGAEFMSVVKADAYGHGMVPVARAAREAGSDYLGVALPVEAMQLRAAGDDGPLMCWLYPPGEDLTGCAAAGVELSAASTQMVDQVCAGATRADRRVRLHLKIDTGLGRNGAQPHDWPGLVRHALSAQDTGSVEIVGIWSHLACADDPSPAATQFQVAAFDDALAVAASMGLAPRFRHLASSGGVLAHPATHYDLVRCGISIYGLTPGPGLGSSSSLGLTPAMTLRSRVALVKDVPAGHGVSYGLRYRTPTGTTLALVPVGYADGLPRSGSGALPLQIADRRFTVVGTIAMDQVVVDVGAAPVRAGDVVTLFGAQAQDGPLADDWAAACGTINYEIVTRLGVRVPRRYTGGS